MSLAVLPSKLNNDQEKAVTHSQGPLLIVAGAGTGKTTVITERVAWLIKNQLAKPDQILALTFTDKAAEEMIDRVDRLLPYGYVDLWVSTFHAFCERILKVHGLDIGLPNDFKLLNQTEQWLLVRQNLDKFNLDYYRPLGNPTKFIHALIKHFSRCKDEEIWPVDYLKYADDLKINLDSMEGTGGLAKKTKSQGLISNQIHNINEINDLSEIRRLEEVANAYHVYQQLLLDNESLDFGDLINYTLKLFRTRPQILEKYRQQFKYILVDEFQDTNWAQYELVKLLTAPQNNLTVVGDDDQSIYKFRGASVSNILKFKEDYPKTKEIFLTLNYRSCQNILDLAYNFIQLNNPERLEVKLKKQESRSKNQELSKKLISQSNDAGLIEHLHTVDEQAEVKVVVSKIIELKNKDKETTWNDFAILVRANAQAEVFCLGFQAAEIPFTYVASKGLYTKEVILDVLAYLKLLDNYHESLALWRVLNLPTIKIKIEDLMELNRFANRKAYSLFESITQANALNNLEAETKRKLDKTLTLIKKHTQLAQDKGVKNVILSFLNDFGYNQYLVKNNNTQAFSYLNQLAEKIEDFEKSFSDRSLKSFMSLVALELEAGEEGSLNKETEEGPEAIKVMTIHSAKGLEFKYVFIVNLVDKRFPSLDRRDPIELPDALVKEIIPQGDVHLQEERRLFYVALTRAKKGVFLTSADNYGGKQKKKLSRFLYEAGLIDSRQTCLAGRRATVDKPASPAGGQQSTNDSHLITTKRQLTISNKQTPTTGYLTPHSFSYSQLKAYETCPYQYYLAFILKVPVVGKATFSYGKTMHTTLQKFMSLLREQGEHAQKSLFDIKQTTNLPRRQAGNKQPAFVPPSMTSTGKQATNMPPPGKLLELYHESWIDDWYADKKQKTEYIKRGEESLKGFYELLKNKPPQVQELEKGFVFKLQGESIKGVIDRIDKTTDGKIELIDYKTGKPKTSKTLEDKDQLLIYQLAAREVFNYDLEKLTYHYLDDNSVVSFLGSDKELEKLKEKIFEEIKSIRNNDFEATPEQHACQFCDFRQICQFRV